MEANQKVEAWQMRVSLWYDCWCYQKSSLWMCLVPDRIIVQKIWCHWLILMASGSPSAQLGTSFGIFCNSQIMNILSDLSFVQRENLEDSWNPFFTKPSFNWVHYSSFLTASLSFAVLRIGMLLLLWLFLFKGQNGCEGSSWKVLSNNFLCWGFQLVSSFFILVLKNYIQFYTP